MIQEIVEHIIKDKNSENYLNGCDKDLVAIIKYYYFEKLEWCGCGMPGEAMRTIARYLEARSLKYPECDQKMREYFPEDGNGKSLVLCLAYELDRAGFTEHGSSVYGCWLTDDGKYFLWAIQEADRQEELDI